MSISFERLQQIILEETIKLIQEQKTAAQRAVEKATGIAQQQTRATRPAKWAAKYAAQEAAAKKAAKAAAKAAAEKIATEQGLIKSEQTALRKLLQTYPALANTPEAAANLVRTGTATAAAAGTTTALVQGGRSAVRTIFINALKGAGTFGLAGGLPGLVVGIAADYFLMRYLDSTARDSREGLAVQIAAITAKDPKLINTFDRRILRGFMRGMGDAKQVREENPELFLKAKFQIQLADARKAQLALARDEDLADYGRAEQQAMLDDWEKKEAEERAKAAAALRTGEESLMSIEEPIMSTDPGLDPALGVADVAPPAVAATSDAVPVAGVTARVKRGGGSLARKARIQQKLNTKIGKSMEDIQAAVGARQTGKYDRDTYNKIVAWQKANLPATRTSRVTGKPVSNYDGLVGSVTFRKMMDQSVDALKKSGTRLLEPSPDQTGKFQSDLESAKQMMQTSKQTLDDYLKSMMSMQGKLTPEDAAEQREYLKHFKAQAEEDRQAYLALQKKADAERLTQKRREATARIGARTRNIEKTVADRPTGAK